MTITEILHKEFCQRFSLSPEVFHDYVKSCPYRYKTYKIAKRDGNKTRTISQPSKDLKLLQKFILERFLNGKLPVHDSATAYRIGKNILNNAQPHLKNHYILKMDFKDFFPSILMKDFTKFLMQKNLVESLFEADMLGKIFFKKEKLSGGYSKSLLSIGSPGSPIISNALLFTFDERVFALCKRSKVAYTRYSDDITFSTNEPRLLFEWPKKVKEILRQIDSPRLSLNLKKTVFSSKKLNRHVTGITITNDGKASIGRKKKRHLRSRVFNAHDLSPREYKELRGYIAFASQIEKDLVKKLREKYPQQMERIMK